MSSNIDQIEAIARHRVCPRPDCGGTILTGCCGTEEEHDYCDTCDWVEYIYTPRPDDDDEGDAI